MTIIRGFQWDAKKNELNLAKHGIDFDEAVEVFYAPYILRRSDRSNEERWIAIGNAENRIITVIYTWRDGEVRLISARRARKNEERTYRQEIVERPPEG
jgi:uncharacterized DUF497 family protein